MVKNAIEKKLKAKVISSYNLFKIMTKYVNIFKF